MNVLGVSESSFLTQRIQKQVVSPKSSEVCLSIDIKYTGVKAKESTRKINSEKLPTGGILCICGAMAQRTVEPDLLMYPKCQQQIHS